METVNLLDVMCATAGSYLFNPPFDLQTDYIQKMILKDLETTEKVMKKEPEETPPSSVDASPLQVHIPGQSIRISASTASPYASPLSSGLLPTHPLHLNGDLRLEQIQQLQHSALAAAGFSAVVAAAANSHNQPSAPLPPNPDWHSPILSGYSSSPSPTMAGSSNSRMAGGCEDETTRKRQVRLLKNREAAKECRRKKKEYVKCLENRVAVLENQNKALIEELKTLKELYCRKEKNEM
ncbi:hypothetical protein WR25_04658 [Diploscapter pachys]|uniref:BZIP domain-containing protein n=1 Tax=Diploscapter pachys TaxID=2018661 RepID=A0A2A2KHP0_9BILA|nr:hypothetical protein WR25_04658 [Diploscapter pachys]